MPDRWNPNSPALCGIEWYPVIQSQMVFDTISKSVSQTLTQSVAQNIGAIRVYVPSSTTPSHTGTIVEVFDDDDGSITLPVTTSVFRPNQTVGGTGAPGTSGWHRETGSTVSVHNSLNDQDDATFAQAECNTNGGVLGWITDLYEGRFNVGVGNLAGQRILRVQLAIRGSQFSLSPVDLLFGCTPSAGSSWSEFKRMRTAPDIVERTANALVNPGTVRPWLITEVEDFDVASEFFLRGFATSPGAFIAVHEVELRVDHVPETRIALGGRAVPTTTPVWREISNVVTPAGGVWTKDAAGNHLYVTRRLPRPKIAATGGGYGGTDLNQPFSVRTLSDGVPPEGQGYEVGTEPDFGTILGMGDANDTLYPLIQRTTAPADSIDSQPYVNVIEARCFDTHLAEQEFSNAAAATYAFIRAVVKVGDDVPDSRAFVCGLEERGVGPVVFAAGITAGDLRALPDIGNGWRLWEQTAQTGGVLAPATQYAMRFGEFTFGPPLTGLGGEWFAVACLDTIGEGNVATFGGLTDMATIDFLGVPVEDARYTLEAALGIVPDPPADFDATLGDQELSGECANCKTESIEFGNLTWTATALGAAFARYEIERSDDGGATWQLIAQITDETIVEFNDYEAKRNAEACYRLRVVTIVGIFSEWTAEQCLTYFPVRCELLLVSNHDPSLNLAYEPNPEREYEFIDAEETVFHAIYGRDFQVAFQPTEQRGLRLSTTLRVACLNPTTMGGAAEFDPLRRLSTAIIPHVTVLDIYGNRFYTHLDVPRGIHREPHADYVAEITYTEITDTPTPVVV